MLAGRRSLELKTQAFTYSRRVHSHATIWWFILPLFFLCRTNWRLTADASPVRGSCRHTAAHQGGQGRMEDSRPRAVLDRSPVPPPSSKYSNDRSPKYRSLSSRPTLSHLSPRNSRILFIMAICSALQCYMASLAGIVNRNTMGMCLSPTNGSLPNPDFGWTTPTAYSHARSFKAIPFY